MTTTSPTTTPTASTRTASAPTRATPPPSRSCRRRPVAAVVRDPEVGALNRITTIHPRTYNEAKNIGEWFRDSVPVIMNLSDMDDADAKRLVDFAAGLVFGLHGTIERVTSKVFLLSPSHVEIAADEPETPHRLDARFLQPELSADGSRREAAGTPA